MAQSIHEIIFDSQSKKFPKLITSPNQIISISALTRDDGTEVFQFIRPNINGNVSPVSGLPEGQLAQVAKADIADYSRRVFGHELPKAISPHEFSNNMFQLDSPSGVFDSRYESVRPNGINQNHGWKIHGDFVADLTHEDALAKAGRGMDLSVIDKTVAAQFDERVSALGIKPNHFLNFYQKNHVPFGKTGNSFIDPRDILTAAETFQESGLTFKTSPGAYGDGRHFSAYPQSLEARDEITSRLESRLGSRLVDQNDPAFRAGLTMRDTGVVNTPISRGISARFTTDYLGQDVATGKFDLATQYSDDNIGGRTNIVGVDQKYKITGKINPEQIGRINAVTSESPEMSRLLHGEDGYVSPYKTIEQIAQERSARKIPVTIPAPPALGSTGKFAIPVTVDEYNYKGPLPPINGRGQVSAPGTPPLTSGPSVSTANATKVTPLAGEYDTGATAAKVASGQPIVTPPPVTSTSVPPVSVPPTTKPPISRGPTVGAPTSVRTTPGPHGAAITPSTAPTPPTAPKTPIIPATSPTAPTAKIISTTPTSTLTARDALRGIGTDIRTARKPGQKLLSADGSKAMAEAVTKGIKGSRNLKMLAVGSALGLGGYTANRLANRNDTSDLRG
jgi:hypothetical protein